MASTTPPPPTRAYVEQTSYSISEARVRVGDRELVLDLTFPPTAIEPLFSGGCWAGSVVWPAALFLANYLAENKQQLLFNNSAAGAVVLELGSGMGVPGIAAGCLGAKRVFLTEQAPLDALLADNVRRLFGPATTTTNEDDDEEDEEEDDCGPFKVLNLDWNRCTSRTVNNGEPIDLVLVSDCIFTGLYGDSWKLLAKVVDVYLGSSSSSNSVCLNSVERRCVDDGVDEFIAYCRAEFNISTRLLCTAPGRIELYELTRMA